MTNCTLYMVNLCPCGRLLLVTVKTAKGDRSYMCNDLVFATGTQTPRLVHELFPRFSHDFHETNNSGDWIIVKSTPTFQDQTCAEVILDDVVHHQLEFVGRKDHATGDFVIWVCGLNNEGGKPGRIDDQAEPDKAAINLLRKYAGRFLWNGEPAQEDGLEVLEKGRTYRPTIGRELPILTSVSRGDLCGSRISKEQSLSGQGDCAKSGIWVCTGHGKYGITLGLGSGKLMSQLILGETPDLDVSALGFPAQKRKKRIASTLEGLSHRCHVPDYKRSVWQAVCGGLGDLGRSCITISYFLCFGWRTKETSATACPGLQGLDGIELQTA
jgi:glycine/D-amino acid oxidase-like deaminating enzyme